MAKLPARARPGTPQGPVERILQYKVVELSTVDEASLESTINEWVSQGWNLDGVQFAMRESSKRPSMGFVFFTREGLAARELERDEGGARQRLRRIAEVGATAYAASGAEPELAPAAAAVRPAPEAEETAFDEEVAAPFYREIDPEVLERADTSKLAEADRIWPDRPDRATDPWRRLAELSEDDDEGNGTGGGV